MSSRFSIDDSRDEELDLLRNPFIESQSDFNSIFLFSSSLASSLGGEFRLLFIAGNNASEINSNETVFIVESIFGAETSFRFLCSSKADESRLRNLWRYINWVFSLLIMLLEFSICWWHANLSLILKSFAGLNVKWACCTWLDDASSQVACSLNPKF